MMILFFFREIPFFFSFCVFVVYWYSLVSACSIFIYELNVALRAGFHVGLVDGLQKLQQKGKA